MKTTIYSILAAAACGMAFGQTAYTTPVGYTTQTLGANKFSFVGLTVTSSTVAAGVLDAESASSVTDTGVDFSTLLTAGATYVLELEDGVIQEVTSWTSLGVLNTPQDISGSVSPGVTKYKLRKASTVSDVFGATNSAGLTPDTNDDWATGNDLIYILDAAGAATVVYYFPGNDDAPAGWYTSAGDNGDIPVVYADGFYVQRGAGSPISLVTSGEVKTKPTQSSLISGWKFLSSVAPAGLTLANSGLNAHLTVLTDPEGSYESVDNIYIPKADGSFDVVYYFDGEEGDGWYTSAGDPADSLALEGSFLILNRGAAKPYTINVPSSYSNL